MPLVSTRGGTSALGFGFGGFFAADGDFESIATVTVGSGGASEVVFDNIPGTYQHLQLRYVCRSSYNPAGTLPAFFIEAKFNAETGSVYPLHYLYGDGASAVASGAANQGVNYFGLHATADSSASIFGGGVVDILDYASTSKNKVARSLSGADNNGSGWVALISTMWPSTAALTKITIAATFSSGTISQHSHFALYGIKAP